MLAVTPALCRIRLDLRIAPGTTPLQVKRELAALVATSPRRSASTSAWRWCSPSRHAHPAGRAGRAAARSRRGRRATGRPHEPVPDNSGATDANILRARGIPTARVGMPKVDADATARRSDFARGMNTVDVRAMRRLCEVLARTAVDAGTGEGAAR